MGLFGWGSKPKEDESEQAKRTHTDLDIPDDVSEYLNKKESSVTDREFKRMLKKQEDQQVDTANRQAEPVQEQVTRAEAQTQPPVPSPFVSHYSDTETSIYKRENPLSEAVLTNCSEIQLEFMKCLRRKGMFQKVSSMATGKDECGNIAEFLNSCMQMQKMALVMFDYASLEKVEECESAKARVDRCFNGNFQGIQDIQDNDKYNKYTSDLKKQREEFYNKFGR